MAGVESVLGSTVQGGLTGASVSGGNPYVAAGGAVIGLASGLYAYYQETGQEQKARDLLEHAQREYGDLSDANVARAMADVIPPTELAKIQQDPRFADAQNKALASLQETADSGGLTAADRAARNDVHNSEALANERAMQASLQGLSRGGLFGSGAVVEQQIAGQQRLANNNSQEAQNEFGQAQRRALEARAKGGMLAGEMGRDDWKRKSDVAIAQDERERALWGNRQQQYRQQQANDATRLGFSQQGYGMDVASAQREAQATESAGRNIGTLLNGLSAQQQTTTTQPGSVAISAPLSREVKDDDPYDTRPVVTVKKKNDEGWEA